MNEKRLKIITLAFQFLDVAGKQFIEVGELVKRYCAENHPRVKSREKTAEDVRKDFELAISLKAYFQFL